MLRIDVPVAPAIAPPAGDALAARQRAVARIALGVRLFGTRTGVASLHESGSARLRLPRTFTAMPEAVVINTAGGVAGGDRFCVGLDVGPGAGLLATSASAEKIYRAESDAAELATVLTVGPGACLEWLPQETILFDGARLRRRLDVDLDPSARVLLFEATVFGRAARGERMERGAFEDRWRVRRGGRLVYADTLRLSGPIADRLARPAVANGARALATCLYVSPDAESRLEEARLHLAEAACECGASAWDGMLAVRFLAPAIETLRRDAARFMTLFRARPLPRVWQL